MYKGSVSKDEMKALEKAFEFFVRECAESIAKEYLDDYVSGLVESLDSLLDLAVLGHPGEEMRVYTKRNDYYVEWIVYEDKNMPCEVSFGDTDVLRRAVIQARVNSLEFQVGPRNRAMWKQAFDEIDKMRKHLGRK